MSNAKTVFKTVAVGLGLLWTTCWGFTLGRKTGHEEAEQDARNKKLEELMKKSETTEE